LTSACRTARLLHSLHAVGIPLTRSQYHALGQAGPESVVWRLLAQHAHLMAARVCELVGMRQLMPAIVLHWAKAKIGAGAAEMTDEALMEAVVPKVRGRG
jgi:hypothetical protein